MPTEKVSGYHWILFAICFAVTCFGGTVSTLMSVYLPVAVKDLLGNTDAGELNSISAYINSVFVFGWAAGGFIWGMIGDRAGRKLATILSIACYGLFTVLTAFMFNWWGVVWCRFMSGFGMGGVLVATTTLMIEEWPESSKTIFMGFLSISMPVGIFSAGLINYVVVSWRQGFFIGIIPLVIAFASIRLLKESEKWKKSRGQIKQRQKHETLFSVGNRQNLIVGSIIFGTMLIGLWAIFSWLPTWIQSLFPATANADKERALSMMLLGMGGLTGGFLSGWLANAIGLRTSILLCFAACSVLAFVLFKTNYAFHPAILAEIALLSLFFGASQGVLSVYVPQLFPTAIRATATGFCFNIGRLFTASAVLFLGLLVSVLGGYGNAIFILSLVFVVGLIVTVFTKDKLVPDAITPLEEEKQIESPTI